MIETGDPASIYPRHKAITAFFPYAAWQEQDGRNEVLDVLLHTIRASREQRFMWHRIIRSLKTVLLTEKNPTSLKQAVILTSPHLPWWNSTIDGNFVQLWAAAADAVPYALDIGQSVVYTLLLIASQDSLRPHIPTNMWLWLSKRPFLPSTCTWCTQGTKQTVVQTVRRLGDIEILTSYLLLVWSERDYLYPDGLDEMCISIREDFCGIKVGHHRTDLIKHLDHILGQLDLGLVPIGLIDDIQSMKVQYEQLKEALLEVDKKVTDVLVSESPRLITIIGLLT